MPSREGLLERGGIRPSVAAELRIALEAALARAEAAAATRGDGVAVLDAGCGRRSALVRFRPRIIRFVGVDIHEPAPGTLPHLDEFATVDVCRDGQAFAPATFDIALSSFTVEHFADPAAAFANLRCWLRPGGTLVLTTVNRRHPFVAAYLEVPGALRHPLQRVVKASRADAHPLVGACNDERAIRAALARAGFEGVTVQALGHLARAWGRTWATFALGFAGDLLVRGRPGRRSTLLVTARVPSRSLDAVAAGEPGERGARGAGQAGA